MILHYDGDRLMEIYSIKEHLRNLFNRFKAENAYCTKKLEINVEFVSFLLLANSD